MHHHYLAGAVAALWLSTSSLVAALSFESLTHEADATVGQAQAIVEFPFTNTGERTVTITDIKSSCGCTVPELEKKIYAQGESGELRAVFTFGDRVGEQVKHITVVTDEVGEDGQNVSHRLTLKTTIPEALKLTPKVLIWRKGDPATAKTVQVEVAGAFENAVVSAGENAAVTVEVEQPDGGESAGKVAIHITPTSTDRSRRAKLPIILTAGEGEAAKTYTEHVFILVR